MAVLLFGWGVVVVGPMLKDLKMATKSRFTLWGPNVIDGERRWGVNERREYGVYTYGPHDGFASRREAYELLLSARSEERFDNSDRFGALIAALRARGMRPGFDRGMNRLERPK